MEAIALPNERVAATATGASPEVAGIRDDEPMCMQITVLVSWQTAMNGSHSPEWIDGRPRCGGISLKHTARAPRSALRDDLRGGQLGVPQRDDRQREELAVGVAAPLLDHPVVVGLDARQAQLAVLGLGEGLPAEPGERREAERRLHVVHPHVLDPGLGLVAPRAHLVVGDRRHRHVVAVEADGGDVALVDVDEVLVHPAVGRRPVRVEGLLVLAAADVLHVADPAALDLGAAVAEALREPRLPHVRGLDDVVVDADDGGQLPIGRGGHRTGSIRDLTVCQIPYPVI